MSHPSDPNAAPSTDNAPAPPSRSAVDEPIDLVPTDPEPLAGTDETSGAAHPHAVRASSPKFRNLALTAEQYQELRFCRDRILRDGLRSVPDDLQPLLEAGPAGMLPLGAVLRAACGALHKVLDSAAAAASAAGETGRVGGERTPRQGKPKSKRASKLRGAR